MSIGTALIAALVGYLFGAVSFARIVGGRLLPGEDLTETEVEVRGSDQKFLFRSVSATTMMVRASPRFGCLTSIFDMLKAFVPTLAFKLLFPAENYYLVTAAASVAGHNFPLYYGFKGGRGISPLFGSLLVIDWLSIPVTNLIGLLVGTVLFRDVIAAYTGGLVLLMPWFWYRFSDPAYFYFAVAVNVLFWMAFIPELKEYVRLRRTGQRAQRPSLRESFEKGYIGLVIEQARERGWIKARPDSEGEILTDVDP